MCGRLCSACSLGNADELYNPFIWGRSGRTFAAVLILCSRHAVLPNTVSSPPTPQPYSQAPDGPVFAACDGVCRYFTAPFAMAVLHLPAPPRLASFLTAAAYCVVNAATLYVFAMRPYTWSDGSVARFMW